MKIYVATTTTNYREARKMMKFLRLMGHRITYDWTRPGRISVLELCDREFRAVLAADVLVMLLPGLLGSHTELGIALGAGKQCIVCGSHVDRQRSANVPFYFCHGVKLLFSDKERLPGMVAEEIDAMENDKERGKNGSDRRKTGAVQARKR